MMEFASIDRELRIEATPEVVYEVISSPEHLREWWPDEVVDFEPTVGGTTAVTFNVPDAPGGVTVPLTVVEADPPRRFSFRWDYEGDTPTESNSYLVTFDLEPVDGGTLLRFSETGFRERGWEAAQLEAAYLDHSSGWDHFMPRLATYAGSLVADR